MLRCLCCVKNIHSHNSENIHQPIIPFTSNELSRFIIKEQSEECAFSGRSDFSRNGRGKNRQIFFWVEGKEAKLSQICQKYRFHLENNVIFAA